MRQKIYSQEDQLDMLLIRSEEYRAAQTKALGRDEIAKLRRDIQEKRNSIKTLKRLLQKEEDESDNNPEKLMVDFLNTERETDISKSKENLPKFISRTNKAVKRIMALKDQLVQLKENIIKSKEEGTPIDSEHIEKELKKIRAARYNLSPPSKNIKDSSESDEEESDESTEEESESSEEEEEEEDSQEEESSSEDSQTDIEK